MRYSRNIAGSVLIELPIVLYVFLILLLFPLLNLGSVCLRSYLLFQACHNAALTAAKSRTFATSYGADLSAIETGKTTSANIAAMYSGVQISNVSIQIVSIDINSKVETIFSTKLAAPADISSNLYQIRVTLKGRVDPLIPFNLGVFGNVAGLTGPIDITMNDQNFVEYPQGLNQ